MGPMQLEQVRDCTMYGGFDFNVDVALRTICMYPKGWLILDFNIDLPTCFYGYVECSLYTEYICALHIQAPWIEPG